ncbi:hypothetical protein AB0081_26520, partial [Klebsiella pneumoniae]
WRMQALSNDGKRMFKETTEDFLPPMGLALRGYAGNHEIKVNGVVWDKAAELVRIATVIMTLELPDSNELAQAGWQVVAPPK